jgi:hypothetical protein
MASISDWSSSNKDTLVQSAITAGGFLVLDKMYYHGPIEWKKGALSFGSSYLSGMTTDWLLPKIGNMSSNALLWDKTYLKPVVSGGLYVAGDMLLKWDGRGWLYPFLFQIGSQAAADYLSAPLLHMA